MRHKRIIGLAVFLLLILPGVVNAQEGGAQQTGTDPRDFAPKFMPYYRYTELENGLKQNEFVAFGLFALSPRIALTYEIPFAYHRDVADTALRPPGSSTCGPSADPNDLLPGGGFVIPGGVLPTGLEGDCQESGMGDGNFRLLFRAGKGLGGDWLVGAQFNIPFADKDVLGSETFSIAPNVSYIKDIPAWPGPGAFFALMNFYQFDVWKDDARPEQSMYIGRWFVMLPLSKKFKIYTLPEFQPIYDFENDHFSFWAGPEFGKMMGGGNILYLKPGFGVSPDDEEGDRDWSFEFGWRKFLD